MKTHLFRTSSILAVASLLLSLGFSGIAQEPRPKQPEQGQQEQQEQQLPELAVQQLDAEMLRVAIPQSCKGLTPVIQTHDVLDNFAPAGSAGTLSPALTNFLAGKPLKGYDDPQVNKYFGDSFRLKNCRVCYATLEVRVRHYGDVWPNDRITVGAAPFSSSPGMTLLSTGIWNPQTPNPKTLTFALPAATLSSYLATTSTLPSFLDIVAQDDTDFDSIKLSVWYY